MAQNKITITSKDTTTPLEIVAGTRRLGVPYIQKDLNLNDLKNVFIQCTSTGSTIYWHDGYFDVSTNLYVKEASLGPDFVWNSGSLDVSIETMDYAYVDGSLAARDVSIDYLNDYVHALNDYRIIQDASIEYIWFTYVDFGSLEVLLGERDVSIDWLADNFGNYVRNSSTGVGLYWNPATHCIDVSIITMDYAYVDGSLSQRDTSIAWNTNKNNNQDTSISTLNTWNINQDACISSLDGLRYLNELRDVSIKDPSIDHMLQYEASTSLWKNIESVDITPYFQAFLPWGTKTGTTVGTLGQWSVDASYLYICTSTNIWRRILMSSF